MSQLDTCNTETCPANSTPSDAPAAATAAAASDSAEKALETEFSDLLNRYYLTLQMTEGCGSRADGYISEAYGKLEAFAREYPEYARKLPRKMMARDDGTDGTASGMAMAADSCKQQ